MISAFWVAVTASLVSLAGQAAHAASEGSLFDDFVRDCAAHAGDAAAPLNVVSQQGWKPIPQQALQAKVPPKTRRFVDQHTESRGWSRHLCLRVPRDARGPRT